jgi:hypothetical protein
MEQILQLYFSDQAIVVKPKKEYFSDIINSSIYITYASNCMNLTTRLTLT